MVRHGNTRRSPGINSVIIPIFLLLSFLWQPVQAAPGAVYYITVDTLTDHAADYEKYACTSSPGDCSLRGAIRFTNASTPGSVIHITIPTGSYYFMRPNVDGIPEDMNVTGDLDILFRTVFLHGAGRNLTILDGQTLDRVLDISQSNVTIEHLKVTQGAAPTGFYGGGGIIIRDSTLRMDDVLVENNSAEGSNSNDNGGGISNLGTTIILNSSIIENDACNGGGINTSGSNLTVTNSTISNNQARSGTGCGTGGGIATYPSATSMNLSTVIVQGNTAVSAGGVFYNGSIESDKITDSIIRDNLITGFGGGIYNNGSLTLNRVTLSGNSGGFLGGGVYNMDFLEITNVTICSNQAYYGGGVYNEEDSTASLDHCTFANNTTSSVGSALYNDDGSALTIHNTILSGGDVVNVCHQYGTVTYTDLGYNLSSDTSCSMTPVLHDLFPTDPKLGSLSFEGGPTPTMLLLPASPAIDTADPSLTLNHDQRLAYRPVDGDAIAGAAPDIGAYEYLSFPPNVFFWLPIALK